MIPPFGLSLSASFISRPGARKDFRFGKSLRVSVRIFAARSGPGCRHLGGTGFAHKAWDCRVDWGRDRAAAHGAKFRLDAGWMDLFIQRNF